jgi:hypothetical protein
VFSGRDPIDAINTAAMQSEQPKYVFYSTIKCLCG